MNDFLCNWNSLDCEFLFASNFPYRFRTCIFFCSIPHFQSWSSTSIPWSIFHVFVQKNKIGVFKYGLSPAASSLTTQTSSSWPRCTSAEARTPVADHHGSFRTFRHSLDLIKDKISYYGHCSKTFDHFSINKDMRMLCVKQSSFLV